MVVRVSLRYYSGAEPPQGATDVVGRVLGHDPLVIERRDGSLVTIEESRILTMHQIPDLPLRTRPAAKWRPEELLAVCSRGWVALESQYDGGWELRASRGFTKRANSAAAHGEPDDLAGRVIDFYTSRGLPPLVQVVSHTYWDRKLRAAGWTQVGELTHVLVKDLPRPQGDVPELPREPSPRWLELHGDSTAPAQAVLGHRTGGFPLLADAAIARVVVTGEWAGISCVKVASSHRRRGLATELLATCELWASQLADKVYVQVANHEIESLYAGYEPHHEYAYLAAP